MILPVVFIGVKLDLQPKGGTQKLFENRVLRRISASGGRLENAVK
jgi:hypothetical protein